MTEYELVLQDLCVICQKTFGVTNVQTENITRKPIAAFMSSTTAVDFLYFFLEISRTFRIALPNVLIENNIILNLEQIAQIVLNAR